MDTQPDDTPTIVPTFQPAEPPPPHRHAYVPGVTPARFHASRYVGEREPNKPFWRRAAR